MTGADPTKLKLVRDVGRPEILFGLARKPETSQLFYGASDGKVYTLDPLTEKPQPVPFNGQHSGYVLGVAMAGNTLITGAYDGKLIWWNTETRDKLREVAAHKKWIRNLAISPDGKLLASVADDMVCRLWNVETGEAVRELVGHDPITPHHYPSMLFAAAFSPDGSRIATSDKVGKTIVWETATGTRLQTLDAPLMYTWDPKQRRHSIGGIRSVAFSPDGKLLAVGGTGQIGNIDHLEALARIEIFDWQTGQRTVEHAGDKYKGLVERIAFHPTAGWLVSAGGDHEGFVKFLDVASGKIVHQDKAPMHIHGLALNEACDTLYATGHGKVAVYELKADPPPAATEPPPAAS